MKLCVGGSKGCESLYISRSVTINGKHTSRTVRTLGTIKDLCKELNLDLAGVMAWGKEQAKIETEKEKIGSGQIMIELNKKLIGLDKTNLYPAGYLFIQTVFYSLKPEYICRQIKTGIHRNDKTNKQGYKYEFDLCGILADLVSTRILYPGSKRSSYIEAQKFLFPKKYSQHQIYRALSVLAENDDYIQEQVFKNSQLLGHRNTDIMYYDVTNYYFEWTKEDILVKFGNSKENRPNPIVQMGLFTDGDGVPLAYNIFEGNANEQTSVSPLENKILEKFGCTSFTYCSDAGLGSEANRMLNSTENRHFIVVQSLKTISTDYHDEAIKPTRYFYLSNDQPFKGKSLEEATEPLYKEIPYTTPNLQQRMIVYYFPNLAARNKATREDRVERAKKQVGEHGIEYLWKNARGRSNPYIKHNVATEDGVVANYVEEYIDYDRIEREADEDGLYALCTDMMDKKPIYILNTNKGRWQIEDNFKMLKSEFKARPVHLKRDDRIKAHFLTCYLALLVYRLLEIELDNYYTPTELIDTLKEFQFTDKFDTNGNYVLLPTYTRTELTDKLHKMAGFETSYEYIPYAELKRYATKTKDGLTMKK